MVANLLKKASRIRVLSGCSFSLSPPGGSSATVLSGLVSGSGNHHQSLISSQKGMKQKKQL